MMCLLGMVRNLILNKMNWLRNFFVFPNDPFLKHSFNTVMQPDDIYVTLVTVVCLSAGKQLFSNHVVFAHCIWQRVIESRDGEYSCLITVYLMLSSVWL